MRSAGRGCIIEAITGSGGAALSGEGFWPSPGITAPAGAQALRGQRTHRAIVWLGSVYGVMEAAWRMGHMSCSTPQEARDALGWQLTTRGLACGTTVLTPMPVRD